MTVHPRVKEKLLSVVIPSYNCAEFIAEAIRSVFRQSYRPIELVIVDDGSTDASRSLIRVVCYRPPVDNFILIEQPNRGAHAAIMCGLEAASGEYLSILNCDDFYHPDRFALLIPYLDDASDLVFSGVHFVDAQGRPRSPSDAWPSWYAQALLATDQCPTVGYALLLHNFSVTSGNFLFTRELYERLGGFSAHRFTHDWDFLIRSVYYSEPVFVREPLIHYRIHGSNTTESVRDLLFEEASDALRRYTALCENARPRNTLAPCAANWPRYFPDFISRSSPFFAPERLLSSFFKELEPHPESAGKARIPEAARKVGDAEWLELLLRSINEPQIDGIEFPRFPPSQVQVKFVGSSFASALHEAYEFYVLVKEYAAALGMPIRRDSRFLDFGCGWGRFLRFFWKDVDPTNLHGCDVLPEILDVCRETDVPGQLANIEPGGRLPYPDHHFDAIMAYSVFTHLPEAAHLHWMQELARVARPGCVFCLTLEPRRFIDFVADIPPDTTSGWLRNLARFSGLATELRRKFDAGEIAYLPTGGGGTLTEDVYGDAVVPLVYIERAWSSHFAVHAYIDDPNRFWQAVLVVQKR